MASFAVILYIISWICNLLSYKCIFLICIFSLLYFHKVSSKSLFMIWHEILHPKFLNFETYSFLSSNNMFFTLIKLCPCAAIGFVFLNESLISYYFKILFSWLNIETPIDLECKQSFLFTDSNVVNNGENLVVENSAAGE